MAAAPFPTLRSMSEHATFLADLRCLVFGSQVQAARYFGISANTISRYERGLSRPPLHYYARLAFLILERWRARGYPVEQGEGRLIRDLNAVIGYLYPEQNRLRDANDLRCVAAPKAPRLRGAAALSARQEAAHAR